MRISPETVRELIGFLRDQGVDIDLSNESDAIEEYDRLPGCRSHAFYDEMRVDEARLLLDVKIKNGGTHCSVCTQHAKIYRRRINSTMARTLIKIWHAQQDDEGFIHTATLSGDTHEASQLVWWGLIEEERVRRPDGGRAGYWRLTRLGERFATSEASVPRYACVYDAYCLRLEGPSTMIYQALGKNFNYMELMSDV